MSSDIHWITAAIAKARQHGAVAPDDVWTLLDGLLKGKFSERQLPSGELAGVAMLLIAAMVPPPPKVESSG